MMKVAFYRADRSTTRRWMAKFADWITGNYGYSHVELIFSNGLSFSSSDRDGGTRFKNIKYDPSRWVIYEIPASASYEYRTFHRAKEIAGQKYDYLGILFYHLIPIKLQGNNRWWCDEAVSYALGFRNFRKNPNKLAKFFGLKPAKEYV